MSRTVFYTKRFSSWLGEPRAYYDIKTNFIPSKPEFYIAGYTVFPYITSMYGGNNNGLWKLNTSGNDLSYSGGVGIEIFGLASNGSNYVAVGGNIAESFSIAWYSTDGENFISASTSNGSRYFVDAFWDGEKFIATGVVTSAETLSQRSVFMTSQDGITWTGNTTDYLNLSGSSVSPGFGVGIGDIQNTVTNGVNAKNYLAPCFTFRNGNIAYSEDFGYTWDVRVLGDDTNTPITNSIFRIAKVYNGYVIATNQFTGYSSTTEIYYNSTDYLFSGWTLSDANTIISGWTVTDFYSDNNEILALCSKGEVSIENKVIRSTDGLTWADYYTLPTGNFSYFSITKNKNTYYITSVSGMLFGDFVSGFSDLPENILFESAPLFVGQNNT